MAKNRVVETDSEKLLVYPKSSDIRINLSDLILKLHDYQKAVKESGGLVDLATVLVLWVPVFSSSFDKTFGVSGSSIRAIYILIALVVTIWLFVRPIILWLARHAILAQPEDYSNRTVRWAKAKETNPGVKAEQIQEECQPSGPLESELIGSSDFRITKATWGTAEKYIDVTEQVVSRVQTGKLNAVASNDLAGSDPVEGAGKVMKITYIVDGIEKTEEFRESHNIDLP